MKKLLSLVALMGMMVGTASAAPYYLSQPASGAITPYDWQPVYSLEGIYNFSDKDEMPDTVGARLNFSLYNDAVSSVRHQFTVSLGFDSGEDKENGIETTVSRMPLTLGYDANIGLTEHVFLDLGAKAGYAWGKGEVTGVVPDYEESMGGFTFGLGAGIKVKCSDSIYVKVGYEFNRTFFRDFGTSHFNFGQHGIVIGAGVLF